MKGNKKITGLMLLAAIGIWGMIFYRLYNSFFSETEMITDTAPVRVKKAEIEEQKTFQLAANYRDPFFGKFTHVADNSNNTIAAKKAVVKKEEIDWSFIRYFGLIKNKNSQKAVALLSVNNKAYMVSEGAIMDEVKLVKVLKDSVRISYKGKTKYIKK